MLSDLAAHQDLLGELGKKPKCLGFKLYILNPEALRVRPENLCVLVYLCFNFF